MQELEVLEQQYAAAQQRRRKRRIRAVIGICVFAVIAAAVCEYLFEPIHLTAEQVDPVAVEKNGIIYILGTNTSGRCKIVGKRPPRYAVDLEKGIDYKEDVFYLEANRFDMFFRPERGALTTLNYYPDGRLVGAEGTHRYEAEDGTAYQLTTRYARVYYRNPDGTDVLLWECEDVMH